MGTSTSKASPLAPTFEQMATWDLKASRSVLQTYKDKDMDFGLDSQGLADLLGGDKEWAESIIDAFRSTTGIINVLAFICGACLVSSGPALEKAGMIFDALDFDGTEQISMDEMTIAFLCCARGFCVISGVGTIPSDEELESVTLQAYRDLNKESTQSITKSEFTKWILEFASGTGAPMTREVALQSALEQFRIVLPTGNVERNEDNNVSSSLQEATEASAQKYDELTQADEFLAADSLQQVENTVELPADESVAQDVEFSERTEPEIVVAGVDEQAPNDNEMVFDGNELASMEIEAQAGNDNYDQDDDVVDQVGEAHAGMIPGEDLAQQIKSEADDEAQVTTDTESDYPTFVADAEETQESTSAPDQTSEVFAQEIEFAAVDIQRENARNRDINADVEIHEPVAASQSECAELEDDDLLYEQDDFIQETQSTERLDAVADPVDVNLPGENFEDTQQTENGTEARATPSFPETMGTVLTPENVAAGQDDSTRQSPRPDFTAFDMFEYQDPRFDGSSGLAPPEPDELLDDSTAPVDTIPTVAER